MNWVDAEYVLVVLAAMLSPLTLTWSVLALVLARRPLRTGSWFYLGALAMTLAIGFAAAFLFGGAAASRDASTPKAWVAVFDLAAAAFLVVWAGLLFRRPLAPAREKAMVERMTAVGSSRPVAVFAAGALLANPGVFVPIALKTISELDPSRGQYFVAWFVFALMSLLPLLAALVLLAFAPDRATPFLGRARVWLVLHASAIAAVIVLVLAAALLRSGVAGLADQV